MTDKPIPIHLAHSRRPRSRKRHDRPADRHGSQPPRGRGLSHRRGLLGNLPVVLRALCDHLLSGEATALDVAYRLASIIDVVDGALDPPVPPHRRH